MKISFYEIEESYNTLYDVIVNEVDILSEAETAVSEWKNVDSFQGDGADEIKSYFETVHGTILKALKVVFADFAVKLVGFITDYHDSVDIKQSSVLCNEYINSKPGELNKINDSFIATTASMNEIINSVSDIFTTTSSYRDYVENVKIHTDLTSVHIRDVATDLENFYIAHLADCDGILATLENINQLILTANELFVENSISVSGCEKWIKSEVAQKLETNINVMYSNLVKGTELEDKMKARNDAIDITIAAAQANCDIAPIMMTLGEVKLDREYQALRKAENWKELRKKQESHLANYESIRNSKELVTINGALEFAGVFSVAVSNCCDNYYDSATGEWNVDAKSFGDACTDTAVELAMDKFLGDAGTKAGAKIGEKIGTALCPVPLLGSTAGKVIGGVVGGVASMALQSFSWGEPPKTIVDRAKDMAKDVTHPITHWFSITFG